MITEDDLLAAAVTIRVMPHAVLSQRLVQLEEERQGATAWVRPTGAPRSVRADADGSARHTVPLAGGMSEIPAPATGTAPANPAPAGAAQPAAPVLPHRIRAQLAARQADQPGPEILRRVLDGLNRL